MSNKLFVMAYELARSQVEFTKALTEIDLSTVKPVARAGKRYLKNTLRTFHPKYMVEYFREVAKNGFKETNGKLINLGFQAAFEMETDVMERFQ